MTESQALVQKLWNFCNILRDDGLSYGDYVEQLTFLLFLKMADERSKPPYNKTSPVPKGFDWDSLMARDGDALENHYRHVLERLGKEKGMLGLIFRKAQNKVQDPAKLRRLIADLIGKETWTRLKADVKGDAYEGLLEKNASDTKGGAGQYFTPRPVVRAIVKCLAPEPGQTICDPACGTGGFLLAAHDYLADPKNYSLTRAQLRQLKSNTLYGIELVDSVARLCCMNLLLHGISDDADDDKVPIEVRDALTSQGGRYYDLVMTNPPFGKKGSITIISEEGTAKQEALTVHRDDFWATTSNKQLNFLQHVFTLLKQGSEAAVVVPDNVLFEGGPGETVRRQILKQTDCHTLLRLPASIFYATGVKANVLFFRRHPASEKAWTKKMWIYDLRTNMHFTLKENPIDDADLDDFVKCYKIGSPISKRRETERFKCFDYDDLVKRDKASLDIFWLKDDSLADSDNLPEPEVIAEEIIEDLQTALEQFSLVGDEST